MDIKMKLLFVFLNYFSKTLHGNIIVLDDHFRGMSIILWYVGKPNFRAQAARGSDIVMYTQGLVEYVSI